MLEDNCQFLCQLDTLVRLTNRSTKLTLKCGISGNCRYYFSINGIKSPSENKGFILDLIIN